MADIVLYGDGYNTSVTKVSEVIDSDMLVPYGGYGNDTTFGRVSCRWCHYYRES